MADNLVTQSTTPSTVPASSVIATDDVDGVHYQKIKLDIGGNGDSTAASGDGVNGLDVDVTRVQGVVTVDDGGATLSVDDAGGSLTVDGTVGISGTVAVSGPLTDAALRATPVPVSGTVTITDGAGPVTVDGTVAVSGVVPVSGAFYQATQPVSGTVAVTGAYQATQPVSLATAPTTPVTGTFFQATQPVSGTVTATGPLTNAELRATAVPVSGSVTISDGSGPVTVDGTVAVTGALTDTELRATPLPVSGSVTISDGSGPVTVDGTVAVSGTVPVSGPITDTQLRAAAVPVSGTVTATGPLTDTQLRASAIPVSMTSDIEIGAVELKNGTDDTRATITPANALKVDGSAVTQPVSGTFWQTTQPVSGTVAVTGAYQATQPVSLATAPTTPVTGPLTNTELRATPVPISGTVTITDGAGPVTVDGTVSISGTVPVSGPLTDAALRATPVPVSGTVTATGPLTDTQLRATAVPVSGTVDVTANTIGLATSAKQDTLLTELQLKADLTETQPVSAASLPLPAGASTAAKQPALGTAGTSSADVITVQGRAAMTPVLVDGTATTQPVSSTTLATNAKLIDGTQQSKITDGTTVVSTLAGDVTQNSLLVSGARKDSGQQSLSSTTYGGIDVSNFSWVSVHVTARTSGTFTWESSNDNVNWVGLPLTAAAALITTATPQALTATAVGMFHGPLTARYFRVTGGVGDIYVSFFAQARGSLYTSTISSPTTSSVGVFGIVPGSGAINLGKTEDAVFASGDTGVMALAVQSNVSSATAADGDYHPLLTDSRGQLHVAVSKAATSTDVARASLATSAQVLAANTARTGLYVTNTDANACYIYFGTTATTTKFTVRLATNERFVMTAPIWTGRIDAIWDADGAGSLIGSELAN